MRYNYEEALTVSKHYFGHEDLPARVFLDKYAMRDADNNLVENAPNQMHERIAAEFARIEKKKFKNPLSYEEIYGYLNNFSKIIPQGSPMFGIGNNHQFCTLSNCYVLDAPEDSYGGILHTDQQLVQIAKRRGGNGIDLSKLRPANCATSNSSRTSTGIVPFAERFSNSTREVGQGGRRGALMLTIDVHHPQVLDFVCMKHDLTKVTGANVSVRLSDEFLSALEKDDEFELRWPCAPNTDSGNYLYDGKVHPEPKIRKRVRAGAVWDAIINSAHATAEPGILFWDSILRESPADCYSAFGFTTISTNPCGEIPLCVLDSCRLLVVNLLSCVRNPFKRDAEFDFAELHRLAGIAQRLMDDLIDLELECIDKIITKISRDSEQKSLKRTELETWQRIREKCEQGRRTGTGITAIGDAMAAVGIKYGSKQSVTFTDKVYRTLKLGAYRSSVDMAKELGSFPIWDRKLEANNPFMLRIKEDDPKLYADMQRHGRRNIALLTTAPTGTTSLVSLVSAEHRLFGTTSGIEPCYKMFHVRRKKITHNDVNAKVDFVDQSGDKWEEFTIYHPGVKLWMHQTGETDPEKSPYAGACAEDIDWTARVRIQATAQKHIDHSISSTINLPENVTVDEVKEIYVAAWKAGCKGMTVYRNNCRAGVLVDKKSAAKITKNNALKRPKELPCDIHFTSVKHEPYYIVVGLVEDEPYEVFIIPANKPKHRTWVEKGSLVKHRRGHYSLVSDKDNVIYENIVEYCSDEQEAIARMVSTSLRHGVDISFVVHQLEKTQGDMMSFSKAVARALKKYIPDGTKVHGETCTQCKSPNIIRQEGCMLCLDCGMGKCS